MLKKENKITKKNLIELYKLPKKVKFCKLCTISNQRPRITFDENDICSACNFAKYKRKVNWFKREEELLRLLDKHRSKTNKHDCVVPSSGGKDSGYVAHTLKTKYGMKPLTVTWSPNSWTEIGLQNYSGLVDAGLDNILGKPDGQVNRHLAKLGFTILGEPFQGFVYGQANFPLKVAVQNEIPLIFYGENGEVEYGGDMINAYQPMKKVNYANIHYFSSYPLRFWKKFKITKQDLEIYDAPDIEQIEKIGIQQHFFGYYHFWDPQENYYYCAKNTNFKINPVRSESTYSRYSSLDDKLDGFHYYLGFIKFGIGRATSDSAHEIRDGKITRDEGIALVKKYDDEFPKKYFKFFLEYLDITEDFFWNVVNSWRSDHIWKKVGKKYKLRHLIK